MSSHRVCNCGNDDFLIIPTPEGGFCVCCRQCKEWGAKGSNYTQAIELWDNGDLYADKWGFDQNMVWEKIDA